MAPTGKTEGIGLLNLIESLGETEWRKGTASQYEVRENGVWVVRDQSHRTPRVHFRFKNEDSQVIERLRQAVESYQGKIKWVMVSHKREMLPGTNWMICPQRLVAVEERALKEDMSAGEYMGKHYPEFGPVAFEDLLGMTAHVRAQLAT